jgi:signal transduction histidine kinase
LFNKFEKAQKGVEKITTEYELSKKEEERKEKVYFSLMSLSLFAANIAHAVRTTIYSINDDALFLKEEPFIAENEVILKKMADRIHREIQRLRQMVDFMLKYAKTDLPAQYFNINQVIQNTFDAHETIFKQKRVAITLNIIENLSIWGNEIFFQDIITNLISNSIKALEGNFLKKIRCSTITTATDIKIIFSDNGIGVPSRIKETMFDIYTTTTQEQGGAGIGLYVVKTNVETLGGTVQLSESEFAPEGATFCITIPFKK